LLERKFDTEVAMNAMRAAVLPEPGAGHYLGADAENSTQTRPDLHLVHHADLAVATPAPAATEVTFPQITFPVVSVPAAALATPVKQRPAGSHPRADHPASPLRLTRRGRIMVAAMAVLLVAALSLVAAGAAQAISHGGPVHPAGSNLTQVVVQPGQSLWSVAENADPNADTRLVIQQIAELNSLNGDTVFAGQRLWAPRS
jgi:hypothetical protein